MEKKQVILVMLFVVATMAACEEKKVFILHEDSEVARTEAGNIRLVRGITGKFSQNNPMHILFITMEPQSLLIPQYLDSTLVLFIRHGEARLGHIYNDKFDERKLKPGDIYTIEAGSAFYLVNTAEGQRLHVICSVHTSHSLSWDTFQSFSIGGGLHPRSVLAGFLPKTLSTALNISVGELSEFLGAKLSGPIVPLTNTPLSLPTSIWASLLSFKQDQSFGHLKRKMVDDFEDVNEEENWVRQFTKSMMNLFMNNKENKKDKAPDSYNVYDDKKDFSNEYGWSIAVDGHDYSPLKLPDVTVYLVNLTAGAMMAPHINPRAMEYGIVLRGCGTIQIVYPNGTLAMNTEVREGDVFVVPRFFPFCQIASRNGPFVFFGFTTSAINNRPQFLAGDESLFQRMNGPELAAALGLSEERLDEILGAQTAQTILPSAIAAPPEPGAGGQSGRGGKC